MIKEIVAIVGVLLIAIGAGMIYHPLALLVLGAGLLLVARELMLDDETKKDESDGE